MLQVGLINHVNAVKLQRSCSSIVTGTSGDSDASLFAKSSRLFELPISIEGLPAACNYEEDVLLQK